MTNEKRPLPPDAFKTWLDYALFLALWSSKGGKDVHKYGHDELTELRKELETTKGLFEQQTKNTITVLALEAMQQRDAAQAERDEVRHKVDCLHHAVKILGHVLLERKHDAEIQRLIYLSEVANRERAEQERDSLLAELRRLWVKEASQDAIEEAAVRYREASEAYQELKLSADMAAVNYAHRRNSEAREDLFAALPARKEGA